MKSRAPDSLNVPMSTEDDDDDFQNPTQAVNIAQNLILSSLRNPNCSQPLRPSNGAPPPRKRQKPSVSNGKENRRAKQVLKSDSSRVSNVRGLEISKFGKEDGDSDETLMQNSRVSHERKEVGDEKSQLLGSIGSGLGLTQSISSSDVCVSSTFEQTGPAAIESKERDGVKEDILRSEELKTMDNCDNVLFDIKTHSPLEVVSSLREERGSSSSMSIESRLLESKTKLCSTDAGDDFGSAELRMEDKDSKSMEYFDGCLDKVCSKTGKASYYSMSVESRLLGSRVRCDSSDAVDSHRDLELGTQLNVLMDLCCEIGEGGSSVSDFSFERNGLYNESFEMDKDGLVECPLCGTNITHLSEEQRHVHTNDCLDKDTTAEVAIPAAEIKSDFPQQVPDVNPVLEWLRTLGLSRYEEAFIKEEVDWETLQWLTEEDLLSIGIVALGPRKKIVHALNELRKKNNHGHGIERDNSIMTTDEKTKSLIPGNKLITEFFRGPASSRGPCKLSDAPHGVEKTSRGSVRKRAGPRSHVNMGKLRDIPPWCTIAGTSFRVDAFRFLRADCSHWFLTHFHMDHYQGLTKNFCHGKIYCSAITAHLVNMKIGIPWERLQILPLNQKITVAGVNLTCLDANHCPGSIIILFEPPNSKAVLHTGDFRFSAEMASSAVLQSCHIHTLVLDTTYCNPQYDFPKQDAVIQFVIEAIEAEAFNPKTLFLIGTYTIGKERLFLEVARLLKKKVYVGAAKLRLLRCLQLPEEDMQWFTANEKESHIHVVPMWTIASFKRMKHLSHQYSGRFNLIVAFSPTGWTFRKGKKKTPGRRWQQGTIIRYEVPYSEHCSFTELREFVQFISPEHVIPSVNNQGPESADAMIALLTSDR